MSQRIKKRFNIALDLCRSSSNRAFTVVEGDTGNELVITLCDAGSPVNIGSSLVQAVFLRPDGSTSSQNNNGNGISITDTNEITIELYASSLAIGMIECEIQIYSGTEPTTLITSAKFNFECRSAIFDESTITSSPYHPILTDLIDQTGAARGAALSAAQTAYIAANECERVTSNVPTDYLTHTNDASKHISALERDQWNCKQDALTAGSGITIDEDNVISSTYASDYSELSGKPSINNVPLVGNKTARQLRLQKYGAYSNSFLKKITGSIITVNDMQNDSIIDSCILRGACTATRPEENLPIDAETNSLTVTGITPTLITARRQSDYTTHNISPITLYGIESYVYDTYDVISGAHIKRIKSVTFNGSEDWRVVQGTGNGAPYFYMTLPVASYNYSPLICTHFDAVPYSEGAAIDEANRIPGCSILENEIRIRILGTHAANLSRFLDILRLSTIVGAPMIVYYALANPILDNADQAFLYGSEYDSYFQLTNDVNAVMDVVYCRDANSIFKGGSPGNVLQKTGFRDLELGWSSLSASSVGAATSNHRHGNIANNGSIGNSSNLPVFTGSNGALTTASPENARDMLSVPSSTQLNEVSNRIPFVEKTITDTSVSLDSMIGDLGFLTFRIMGGHTITKPDPDSPISPSNIAVISPKKANKLIFTALNNTVTEQARNFPSLFGIGDACDSYNLIDGAYRTLIHRYELDGTENWTLVPAEEGGSNYFSMTLPQNMHGCAPLSYNLCTHFESVDHDAGISIASDNTLTGCCVSSNTLSFRPDLTVYPTLSDWTSFLAAQYAADTPVIVYYESLSYSEMGGNTMTMTPVVNSVVTNDANVAMEISFAAHMSRVGGLSKDYSGTEKKIIQIRDGEEYHFGTLSALTIYSYAIPYGDYMFSMYFNSSSSISVSIPASIRWAGGTPPSFLPDKTYELSVKNGLGKLEVYDNA